jgi:hypothetical protein
MIGVGPKHSDISCQGAICCRTFATRQSSEHWPRVRARVNWIFMCKDKPEKYGVSLIIWSAITRSPPVPCKACPRKSLPCTSTWLQRQSSTVTSVVHWRRPKRVGRAFLLAVAAENTGSKAEPVIGKSARLSIVLLTYSGVPSHRLPKVCRSIARAT